LDNIQTVSKERFIEYVGAVDAATIRTVGGKLILAPGLEDHSKSPVPWGCSAPERSGAIPRPNRGSAITRESQPGALGAKTVKLRGIPGVDLLGFAGHIPPDDLQRMSDAIEEGCEAVNLGE
jgi:hypothetical protein